MSLYERHTFGLVKTLEKRPAICDIHMSDFSPAEPLSITTWETKFSCTLPEDLRSFYLTMNGLTLRWSVRMNADTSVPVGRLDINPVEKLNRLSFGVAKDHSTLLTDLYQDLDEESHDMDMQSKPTFDHKSRIFELDSCDGYSRVCLVYSNTKLGVVAQCSSIWLLDRALRWHFLASSFMNYYCQAMIHLGLPQWQQAFTDIGISPQAKQWFNLLCPSRVMDQPADDVALTNDMACQPSQLDVAKVFKGKTDKKKPIGSQIVKKKPPLSSLPVKPGSGKGSSSNFIPNKTNVR